MTDPAYVPFELTIDGALIAGMQTPTLTVIERAALERGWDQTKSHGYSGGFSVYTGDKLIPFDLIFRLFSREDWDRYRALRPFLMTPPRVEASRVFGGSKAIDILHPILADLGVRSFVITKIHQLRQTDPGVWEKQIECLQFRKAVRALAKPEASAQKPAVDDPYDKIIEYWQAENQRRNDELAQ